MEPSEVIEVSLVPSLIEVGLIIGFFSLLFTKMKSVFTRREFLQSLSISYGTGMDITCKAVSATFAMGATCGGLLLMTHGDLRRSSPFLPHLLLLCIAYFLYDTGAMFRVYVANHEKSCAEKSFWQQCRQFVASQPMLVAHHLLLSLFFTPLMFRTLDHEPGDLMIACALIFEASTPFVSLRAILSHVGLKRSPVYLVNGLLMVVVFLCCRVLVFPWFYLSYAKLRGISFWAGLFSTPPHCALFMGMVLLPQVYWFRLMVLGAIGVIADRKTAARADKESNNEQVTSKSNGNALKNHAD